MTYDELKAWAESRGWQQGHHGHFHKVEGDTEVRIKVQKISIRFERACTIPATQYSKAEKRWMRMRSGYLSALSVGEDGKLAGLTK